MAKRQAELVMGIIAGIIGILSSLLAIVFSGLGAAFNAEGASYLVLGSFVALLASVFGIIGAAMVDRLNQWSGVMMIGAAIVGFLSISYFYLISTILFGIAGALALYSKGEEGNEPKK